MLSSCNNLDILFQIAHFGLVNRGLGRPVDSQEIFLQHATEDNPEETIALFNQFLVEFPDEHVRERPDDVLRRAIIDKALYFCRHAADRVVATTGLYRYGEGKAQWAEIGSTLVQPKYRGMRLQATKYCHIIALTHFSDWPAQGIFAATDIDASASIASLQRVGFEELHDLPPPIVANLPGEGWLKVRSGAKRLFVLSTRGRINALNFVLEKGSQHPLVSKDGELTFIFSVEFRYLTQPGIKDALVDEIAKLEAMLS